MESMDFPKKLLVASKTPTKRILTIKQKKVLLGLMTCVISVCARVWADVGSIGLFFLGPFFQIVTDVLSDRASGCLSGSFTESRVTCFSNLS